MFWGVFRLFARAPSVKFTRMRLKVEQHRPAMAQNELTSPKDSSRFFFCIFALYTSYAPRPHNKANLCCTILQVAGCELHMSTYLPTKTRENYTKKTQQLWCLLVRYFYFFKINRGHFFGRNLQALLEIPSFSRSSHQRFVPRLENLLLKGACASRRALNNNKTKKRR